MKHRLTLGGIALLLGAGTAFALVQTDVIRLPGTATPKPTGTHGTSIHQNVPIREDLPPATPIEATLDPATGRAEVSPQDSEVWCEGVTEGTTKSGKTSRETRAAPSCPP